jgi:O-acetyl-ADP-ribose deacetylase (regulator of RNase III)
MALDVEESFLDGRVVVLIGDLTQQNVSAIVNAANSTLLGGGGVDGAIHRVGGPQIKKECEEIRSKQYPKGLPTGEAVITTGGNLQAKFVIHTVGPIFGRDKDGEAKLLASCYQNSLRLATEHHLTSIAFPSISTGAFGYPRDQAAAISSAAIAESLSKNAVIEQVRLVYFQKRDARVFLQYQIFG